MYVSSYLLILIMAIGSYHDFYLSLFQIRHNTEANTLEISIKVFSDDLEKAISTQTQQTINLATTTPDNQAQQQSIDTYISRYVAHNLQISINDTTPQLNFIGKEVDLDDATWLYFEINLIDANIDSMAIECYVLTELFGAQINMFQLMINEQEYSAVLHKGKTQKQFTFN